MNAMQANFNTSSLSWGHYTALMNQAKRAKANKNPSFDEGFNLYAWNHQINTGTK